MPPVSQTLPYNKRMAPPKMPKIHSAYIYPSKKAAAPEKPCTKRDHKNQEIIMKKSSIDKCPRIF